MNRQTVGGMTLSDPPLTRGMRYGPLPPQQVRDQQGPSDHVTEEGCCKPFSLGVRALPESPLLHPSMLKHSEVEWRKQLFVKCETAQLKHSYWAMLGCANTRVTFYFFPLHFRHNSCFTILLLKHK